MRSLFSNVRFVTTLAMLCAGTGGLSAASKSEVKLLETPGKVRFGVLGEKGPTPAPTVFVFASDIEGTLQSTDYYNKVGAILAAHGWIAVSLDLPCHGRDAKTGEPAGLAGWRSRLEKGDVFVPGFVKQVSEVLDELIAQGYTDPNRVAVCGTSRGGFIALHCAAADPRFHCAAAFAPVTNLIRLSEFQGLEQHAPTNALALIHAADKLGGRAVWVCIGNHDERVNTDDCIATTRAIVKSSIDRALPAAVELHVMAVPGHKIHPTAHEEVAAWMLMQIESNKAEKK